MKFLLLALLLSVPLAAQSEPDMAIPTVKTTYHPESHLDCQKDYKMYYIGESPAYSYISTSGTITASGSYNYTYPTFYSICLKPSFFEALKKANAQANQ